MGLVACIHHHCFSSLAQSLWPIGRLVGIAGHGEYSTNKKHVPRGWVQSQVVSNNLCCIEEDNMRRHMGRYSYTSSLALRAGRKTSFQAIRKIIGARVKFLSPFLTSVCSHFPQGISCSLISL